MGAVAKYGQIRWWVCIDVVFSLFSHEIGSKNLPVLHSVLYLKVSYSSHQFSLCLTCFWLIQ